MSGSSWSKARRVLAVRLDNLGDVLLCTAAFRAIKEHLPRAQLTLLASPSGAQVAELCPYLDEVIVFDAPWMDVARELPQNPAREFAMIEKLRRRGFDGAIIFTSYHQSALPAAYMCYLAGIPLRHAASVDFPGTLLTSRHRYREGVVHEVERQLDLVAGIGFTTDTLDMALVVPARAKASMRKLLAQRGVDLARPLVVVHPGSTASSRRYPWQRYAVVADALVEQHGCQVVLTGTAGERELARKILARMRRPAGSLAGETSFAQLGALIELANLVITNNTGPQHVASALKTPAVVLFALTNPPEQWGPWRVPHRTLNHGVPCALCYKFECPLDHACLEKVAPEQVVQAATELLAERALGGMGA